ncbi:uncharacterized protein SAPINGB_P003238 [Magnusiomyces paraingens]|uniref:Protein PNS1 n=1 Tax=Magnusiomyces paraingens TaxID=2606893 RepID=A0A5E8BT09_9ASCO|nr:uncharacterized protein SAPINGB_P003238 [Saprochaete ingens]VVT51863.1 unnamed protein product [Saprochaete ingens]
MSAQNYQQGYSAQPQQQQGYSAPPPPAYDQQQQPQSTLSYNEHQQFDYDDSSTNALKPPPINYATKPQESGETFNDRFKVEKPKWNDIPFTLFFLLVVAGFIAIAVITLRAWAQTYGFQGKGIYSNNNSYSLDTNAAILFCFVTVVAFVFAIVLIALMRAFTKFFIYLAFIVSIIVGIGTAIFYLAMHYYSAGIVFLIFGVLQVFFFIGMRSRIPFATLVFGTIIDVTRSNPSIFGMALAGTIVSTAFSFLFSMVIVATYMKYDPNADNPGCNVSGGSCSNGKLIGVLVFVSFAGFYITEVIKNVTHTTICGIYGTWYYCSKSDQGMPRRPALGSLRRALTYSFGSISFGSLIVAIVNLIRYLLDFARSAAQQDMGNDIVRAILMCLVCFAQCFMGIIEWMVTYFNHYAYTFVALYGRAYIPAARDTWTVIRARGIDALINDCLIDHLLTFTQMLLGYLCAMMGYCFLRFTRPRYNSSGGYFAIITMYSMFIGIQVGATVMVAVRAGTATLFVALAKDPEVFRLSYPDTYHKMLETYPAVREKLNFRE